MAVSAGLMAAGAATSAIGAYGEAKSQKANLSYQSDLAAQNAAIAQTQASLTEENGQQASMNNDLKTAQVFGAQRAALSANGVDLGQGSANELLTTTKFMGAKDSAQIQDNALRAAWGYKVQAADDIAQSKTLDSMSSSISPTNAAFTSLLGGASKVNSAWNSYATANGRTTSDQAFSNLFT